MRTTLLTALFAGLLALLPLSANALDSALESEQVSTYITSSLVAGTSPADIIRALVDYHDMTLSEATVFAMVVAGPAYHADFATAGIGHAVSLEEAQEVADAVIVVDASMEVARAVNQAINRLVTAPEMYRDNYSNFGGLGVSPAS